MPKGQSLVEFVVAAALASITIGMGAQLLHREWKISQCVYSVFESAHSHLTGRRIPIVPAKVQILELGDRVQGTCRWGSIVERVELPKLEYADWTGL